jgi:ATP-dependent Clp protease adaptor protein ClpS
MPQVETIQETESSVEVKQPKMYKVMLHNDNSTTFGFVIAILTKVFHRTMEESIEITQNIHFKGQDIAGAPYTKEVAEEKVSETISFSRANGFPLVATAEEL